jgi:hypothetical protein
MKPLLSTFIVFLIVLVVACAPLQTSQPVSVQTPNTTSEAITAVVVTAQGGGAVGLPSATAVPLVTKLATADGGAGSVLPANGVTLSANGKTFVMHIGESFLLNLGMDVYDWSPEVDNQNVLHREMGVLVIRGAQGIYIAQNPGTAILSASGNPKCLQSKPPCMMPSILFMITVIVQ